MAAYAAPVADVAFLLGKVFDFDRRMAELPGCEEVDTELAVSVLEEAGKFASGVLEPLNRPGDEEGCRLVDGKVATPKGMAEAYRAFAEAGWCSLSGDPEYGGQGLPPQPRPFASDTHSAERAESGRCRNMKAT